MEKIKSAIEMIDEVRTIQEGYFKGAIITLTNGKIEELMQKYREQFEKYKNNELQ